jgi:hypothetical protein
VNEACLSKYWKEDKETKATTKVCPKCGNTYLLLLATLNKKICTDCDTVIPWYLDKGQKPLC